MGPVDPIPSTIERTIARIAERRHGIITRAEMRAADISDQEIKHRVRIGLLYRVHRGVYSVGHGVLTTEARYMAAVKACGEGAVLCGRAAAHLLGILRAAVPPPREVMTPTERKIKDIKSRRGEPHRREVARVKGIPCTTPARTIVDLAPRMDDGPFARVCHEAGVRYRTTPREVKEVMARRGRCNGAARIRRVMDGEAKVTLSVMEDGLLDVLRAEDLPLPDTNKKVGKRRVDCHWAKYGLTVELVSFTYHSSSHAFEADHDREREARGRGEEWRQFTYRDVFVDQTYMLGELRKLLPAKLPC